MTPGIEVRRASILSTIASILQVAPRIPDVIERIKISPERKILCQPSTSILEHPSPTDSSTIATSATRASVDVRFVVRAHRA